MLARLEVLHQFAVLTFAQQVAANGGRVQMGGVEIDEGLVALLRAGHVDTLCLGADEGVVHLASGQVHAADGAVAGQFGPVARLVEIFMYQGDFWPGTAASGDQAQVHGDRVRGAHDDLVDDHHRHRGAGHGIDGHRALVA